METERLAFGHWTAADLALAEAVWGSPDVARFIAQGGAFDAEAIAQRLRAEVENQRAHGVQYWPLFFREDQTPLGCCGLRPYPAAGDALEFGVHLLPAAWGQGIAQEAGRAVLAYAKDVLGAREVYAGHHPDNAASARMLGRLGFTFVREEFYPPTGRHHPTYRIALAHRNGC